MLKNIKRLIIGIDENLITRFNSYQNITQDIFVPQQQLKDDTFDQFLSSPQSNSSTQLIHIDTVESRVQQDQQVEYIKIKAVSQSENHISQGSGNKITVALVQQAIKNNCTLENAVEACYRYGMPVDSRYFGSYRKLILRVIADSKPNELSYLRCALSKFINELKAKLDKQLYYRNQELNSILKFCNRNLNIIHLLDLRNNYKAKSECKQAQELNMYTSIMLLRYQDQIRRDKLYLEAGNACRKSTKNQLAVQFFKQFLEINSLIDNKATNNQYHKKYGIIPHTKLISYEQIQEIKDWVYLTTKKAQQEQIMECDPSIQINCKKCGTKLYFTSHCYKCNPTFQSCIVTGLPLDSRTAVNKCLSCKKLALQQMLDKYLQFSSECPWCGVKIK